MRGGLRAQVVSETGFTVFSNTARISTGFNSYKCLCGVANECNLAPNLPHRKLVDIRYIPTCCHVHPSYVCVDLFSYQ